MKEFLILSSIGIATFAGFMCGVIITSILIAAVNLKMGKNNK
jgi:hypothetical protein